MSLTTKPEEMFRALVEATAFGCRAVIENYNSHGVPVTDLTACGGIAVKDPVTMQIYADVLGQEIRIAGSAHGPATGSAILAAYASGEYDTIAKASEHMGSLSDTVYRPIPHNVVVYNELYREYMKLHDYFRQGQQRDEKAESHPFTRDCIQNSIILYSKSAECTRAEK